MQHAFSEVWVISLKRREDRLVRFFENIRAIDWPFHTPKPFAAIDGDKVGVPHYWQTGGGSYGCHRSHMLLLEHAVQDDVESILIMEDDATFMADFGRRVQEFMSMVPNDWECLMLGGQHMNSTPVPISPGVVKAGSGGGIQRTHCYAIRGTEAMRELYRVWADCTVHCDWVMGPCLAKRRTYAPDPFLVGQAFGKSDISGSLNPAKFWKAPTWNEPVIVLKAPRAVMETLQQKGWHGGFNRDALTGIDVGLLDALAAASTDAERMRKLGKWIEMIQWEVVSMENAIACIWHPEASGDMVGDLIRGQVIEITAASWEDAQRQLSDKLRNQSLNQIAKKSDNF